MSKVTKWKRKISSYYTETQHQKFISDLESSGFKVGLNHDGNRIPSDLPSAFDEIAAGKTNDTIVSKDGSIAVIIK